MVHRTPFFLPLLYPSLIWRIPDKDKELYLTFDDGPVPGPTEFVLEVLKKYNAKATFFCIGDNVRKHPSIFKEISAGGHALGNHTFNHLNGWRTKAKDYRENVNRCEEVMAGLSLQPSAFGSKLFRPPYGRITGKQMHMMKDYKIIMWDVLSMDYNKHLSREKCFSNTVRVIRPGSIIVFHDSYKAERNMVYALPRVMEHLLDKGFIFKTLA